MNAINRMLKPLRGANLEVAKVRHDSMCVYVY